MSKEAYTAAAQVCWCEFDAHAEAIRKAEQAQVQKSKDQGE